MCPPDLSSPQCNGCKSKKYDQRKLPSNNLNDLKSCAGLSNNLNILKAALGDVFRMVDVLKGGLGDVDTGDPCPVVDTFAPNADPKHWLQCPLAGGP